MRRLSTVELVPALAADAEVVVQGDSLSLRA
jgi:hypothetical protein